jgi:hypothetical protein
MVLFKLSTVIYYRRNSLDLVSSRFKVEAFLLPDFSLEEKFCRL